MLVKEAFYSQLDQTLARVPKQDIVILMGDFNAKVGNRNEDIEHIIGKQGLGVMNENGKLLVDFCGAHNLRIRRTLFPHKDCHKVTWVSPNGRNQNQIDHICISSKWSKALLDVRNKRGADVGSDHHLLIGELRLYFKITAKKIKNVRKKFCVSKLKTESAKNNFVSTLKQKISESNISVNSTIDCRSNKIKSSFLESCEVELGIAKKKADEYITDRTWPLNKDEL